MEELILRTSSFFSPVSVYFGHKLKSKSWEYNLESVGIGNEKVRNVFTEDSQIEIYDIFRRCGKADQFIDVLNVLPVDKYKVIKYDEDSFHHWKIIPLSPYSSQILSNTSAHVGLPLHVKSDTKRRVRSRSQLKGLRRASSLLETIRTIFF